MQDFRSLVLGGVLVIACSTSDCTKIPDSSWDMDCRYISAILFYFCLSGVGIQQLNIMFCNHRYYLEDPVLNPLTPWSRPPIRNVYCMYGVDMKTEVDTSHIFQHNLYVFDVGAPHHVLSCLFTRNWKWKLCFTWPGRISFYSQW